MCLLVSFAQCVAWKYLRKPRVVVSNSVPSLKNLCEFYDLLPPRDKTEMLKPKLAGNVREKSQKGEVGYRRNLLMWLLKSKERICEAWRAVLLWSASTFRERVTEKRGSCWEHVRPIHSQIGCHGNSRPRIKMGALNNLLPICFTVYQLFAEHLQYCTSLEITPISLHDARTSENRCNNFLKNMWKQNCKYSLYRFSSDIFK